MDSSVTTFASVPLLATAFVSFTCFCRTWWSHSGVPGSNQLSCEDFFIWRQEMNSRVISKSEALEWWKEPVCLQVYTYACLWHTHREKIYGSFLWLIRSTLQVLSFYKVLTAFLTHSVAEGYFFFGVIKFNCQSVGTGDNCSLPMVFRATWDLMWCMMRQPFPQPLLPTQPMPHHHLR